MIIEKMSSELSLPLKYVDFLALTASHQYKQYTIPKRTGGQRTILHPSRKLKALQRWLLSNVIARWPVHPAAMAYRSGISIFDNANIHVQSQYLLRMDMTNFFPSIEVKDLVAFMAKRPTLFEDWTDRDKSHFARLVFRHGKLTVGAPTSPSLSNALCFELDSALAGITSAQGVAYSRYADDLFFSANKKQVLISIEAETKAVLNEIKIPANLSLNQAKTKHSSKRGARRVTGIVLGSDGKAYVSRDTKRTIRTLVHQLDTLKDEERIRLAGLISYVSGFEPAFLNNLILKYGADKVSSAKQHT